MTGGAGARSDGRRWRWLLLPSALVVAGAVIAIAVTSTRPRSRHSAASVPGATLPSVPAVTGTTSTAPPSVAELQAPVAVAQLTEARRAAHGFLGGYLRYLYGHARASDLTDLTPGLRAELARQPPHVSSAQRARHPRLLSLAAVGQAPDTVLVTATVADGGAPPYPIRLTLGRQARRWVVAAIPS